MEGRLSTGSVTWLCFDTNPRRSRLCAKNTFSWLSWYLESIEGALSNIFVKREDQKAYGQSFLRHRTGQESLLRHEALLVNVLLLNFGAIAMAVGIRAPLLRARVRPPQVVGIWLCMDDRYDTALFQWQWSLSFEHWT